MKMNLAKNVLLTMVTMFAAAGYSEAQCNSNDSSAPCFTNNSDILNGRKSLLQDDDLMVVGAFGGFNAAGAIALTTNSQISSLTASSLNSTPKPASNPVAITARLFSEQNEQVISATSNNAGLVLVTPDQISVPPMAVVSNALGVYGVAADFLGTGFDQVILMVNQFNSPLKQIAFQGMAAVDPYHPASGLKVGQVSQPVNNASTVYAIAAGIFTDPVQGLPAPRPQIAVYSSDPTGTSPNGVITFYSVDANLNVTLMHQSLVVGSPSTPGNTLWSTAIVSGRFTGGTHDQLVVAYAFGGLGFFGLGTVDFNPKGAPVLKNNMYINTSGADFSEGTVYGGSINLRAGHFDWFSQSDQVALSYFQGDLVQLVYGLASSLQVVSFDATMTPTFGPPYQSTSGCPMGLAVGRFDRFSGGTPPQINPNLQIAQFINQCFVNENPPQPGSNVLALYDVDPTNNFAISQRPLISIPTSIFANPPSPYNTNNASPVPVQIVAADIQGRSLPLGPPTKATVLGHIQPDTVLGLPPMHVDWIAPTAGSAPEIFNVSVFPSTFNTSYSFASGSSDTVSRTAQTSVSVGAKQTVNESLSFGIPEVFSEALSAAQAANNLEQNTVSKNYNTYSGQKNSFTTVTAFDDVVAATSMQMNIYNYRVIGQCVTGANATPLEECPAGKRPLYVQFSGPDNVDYVQAGEGRNLEWYQPVQEPGNIFSYPANVAQFQADLGGGTTLQPLSPQNNLWDSQTNSQVIETWSQGGGSAVSSGSESSHSYDSSFSVSDSLSLDGFGAGVGVSYDYNQSTSNSTLNQSTTVFSNSQGITLNRGVGDGPNNAAAYDYQGQSLIYGETPPAGVTQTGGGPDTAVQANGFIGVAHFVDMLSQGSITSGNFWPQAYGATPDIALNHPQRWIQKTPSGTNSQQVQFNCPIGFSSSLSSPACTSNTQVPTPANVADASFYLMKGFFITPGNTTSGPQIVSAFKGDQVNLRVRVYNYSLASFPSGSKLHVQFYAQPWGAGEFAGMPGEPNTFQPAVFIGEGTDSTGNPLAPVPAFCGGYSGGADPCVNSSVRNWEFAYATWDTSGNNVPSNSTWKFWVVTWVENNGALIAELPGHGLTEMPASPFNSIGDVPVEIYSNNLGYYNQVFTVLAPPGLGSTNRPKTKPSLILSNLGLRNDRRVLRDTPTVITAKLRSTGSEIHSTTAYYYDGNPNANGVLFDVQKISNIPSRDGFVDRANFTPKTCGPHRIYVRAVPADGSIREASLMKTINVTIDPVDETSSLISYVQKTAIGFPVKTQLLRSLTAARDAYQSGHLILGDLLLETFRTFVQVNRKEIPSQNFSALQDELRDAQECIK